MKTEVQFAKSNRRFSFRNKLRKVMGNKSISVEYEKRGLHCDRWRNKK